MTIEIKDILKEDEDLIRSEENRIDIFKKYSKRAFLIFSAFILFIIIINLIEQDYFDVLFLSCMLFCYSILFYFTAFNRISSIFFITTKRLGIIDRETDEEYTILIPKLSKIKIKLRKRVFHLKAIIYDEFLEFSYLDRHSGILDTLKTEILNRHFKLKKKKRRKLIYIKRGSTDINESK